ncbi:MAG: N-acetylneuraminate synthase [Nitrospinota bacterium]|nr:N-acetylneuraminate synthase [Nitrospinota bacterium]
MSCFIIAEAGVNHNGSEELALKLVDVASQAGADAVKFQTFRAEDLVAPGTEKAEYQKENTEESDQFSMIQNLELSREAHQRLKSHCDTLGIEFMSTPFDSDSADFLVDLGMQRIKIPSGELTNLPFIAYIAEKGLPVIMSTGMSTMDEVLEAVQTVRDARCRKNLPDPLEDILTLLHCTSNYPALPGDIHLNAMLTLKEKTGLPVGYSDHSDGILVAPLAVGLGALVIEKHFTLDRTLPGPDHKASLEPEELNQMIHNIRTVEQVMGSPEKAPTPSELPVRDVARRSVTLARNMACNETLSEKDLVLLRPGNGIPPKDLDRVMGCKVKSDLPQGHTLQWSDLQR